MAKNKSRAEETRDDTPPNALNGRRTSVAVAAAVVIAFFGGYVIRGSPGGVSAPPADHGHVEVDSVWICSMNNNPHPPVIKDAPGKCDYCGMDLIQQKAGASLLGPRQIRLSDEAAEIAKVRTAVAERKFVDAEVRLSGKIVYDETRMANIAARVGGRIDDLYADYTGVPVKKGEHLFKIYSPEFFAAKQDLLQALKHQRSLPADAQGSILDITRDSVEVYREKLRLWGVTDDQIRLIESGDASRYHLTVNSPIAGVVVQKRVTEGSYVDPGTVVYVVADLTTVWVQLDAYETDVSRLRYAQTVTFTTDAFPGESFEGSISFISPILDDRKRTAAVRVNLPNGDGRLMPGMLVRGIVRSRVTSTGSVLGEDMSGKWISPMHPEVVKDAPGACDVCGMPLVSAESLGYVAAGDAEPPLVIPATAPLITGKRAIVYVSLDGGIYEGRTVVLGHRAGEHYIVREGLEEGEAVVVNGNFKIDSAIQILGKPSMMGSGGVAPSPHHHGSAAEGDTGHGLHDHAAHAPAVMPVTDAFSLQLDGILGGYFALQLALSRDDFPKSKEAARELNDTVTSVDASSLAPSSREQWEKSVATLTEAANTAASATDVIRLREAFHGVSNSLIEITQRFGTGSRKAVYRAHCPMAFNDTGADWLAEQKVVENPYFGAQMFSCGVVKETISPDDSR